MLFALIGIMYKLFFYSNFSLKTHLLQLYLSQLHTLSLYIYIYIINVYSIDLDTKMNLSNELLYHIRNMWI